MDIVNRPAAEDGRCCCRYRQRRNDVLHSSVPPQSVKRSFRCNEDSWRWRIFLSQLAIELRKSFAICVSGRLDDVVVASAVNSP